MEAEIKEVNSLTFSAFNVPGGVGIEPKINGIAFTMDKEQLSEPIEGITEFMSSLLLKNMSLQLMK